MKIEVSRCPNCGSRTIVEDIMYSNNKFVSKVIIGYQVKCRSCKMAGPVVELSNKVYISNEYKNKQRRLAILLWNSIADKFELSKNSKPIIYIDSTLSNGEEPATNKQILFAKAIADKLDLKIPIEQTKKNLQEFLSQNVDKYYATKKHHQLDEMRDSFDDDEFMFNEIQYL